MGSLTVTMKTFVVLFVIIRITTGMTDILYQAKLVLELQDRFKSDSILFIRSNRNGNLFKFVRRLNYSPKAFVGAVNLDEKIFPKEVLPRYTNTMIVLDFQSESIKKIIDVQKRIPLLMSSTIFILFIERDQIVNEAIRDLYIPLISKFFLIKKINQTSFEISDVYQVSQHSSKIYSLYGTWKNGELEAYQGDFYSRRTNLQGHRLKVALSELSDFRKVNAHIYSLLSGAMNFSVKYVHSSHGKIYPNGTISGLFDSIMKGDIDATSMNYVYRKNALAYFDFIFPTVITDVRIYVNLETKLNWASYLAPFRTEVWITILCWIIISSLLIEIIIRLSVWKYDSNVFFERSIFQILRALCYQGGKANTSSLALKLTYIMPYILAVVLIQFYSGIILSYLTVKNSDAPFQSLKDVIKDGSYKISTLNDGYILHYFLTDPGAETAAIRKKLLPPLDQLPKTAQEGYHQLCENRWIFLCSSVNAHKIKQKCNIIEINQVIFHQSLGILVKKGFPYRGIMTKLLKRLQFAGLLKLKSRNTVLPPEDADDFKSLSMESVFFIFLIYLSVSILSCVVLICEIKLK